MLRGVVLSILSWATAMGVASAQDAAAETSEAETPQGVVIVVVESARRSIRPEAIRSALSERLNDADVAGLRASDDAPRARVIVAVHRDGSADLHVVSRNGNEDAAHLPAAGSDHSPAAVIAERIGELLGEAEDDPPIGTVARHGLIPWEEEGLRPYPDDNPYRRVESDALLPWPNGRPEGTPTHVGPNAESAAGLGAPPPRSGAQKR